VHGSGFHSVFDCLMSIIDLEHSADLTCMVIGFLSVASNDFDVGLWEVLLWCISSGPFNDVPVGHLGLADGVGDPVLAHTPACASEYINASVSQWYLTLNQAKWLMPTIFATSNANDAPRI
jgi:hypothetical protein